MVQVKVLSPLLPYMFLTLFRYLIFFTCSSNNFKLINHDIYISCVVFLNFWLIKFLIYILLGTVYISFFIVGAFLLSIVFWPMSSQSLGVFSGGLQHVPVTFRSSLSWWSTLFMGHCILIILLCNWVAGWVSDMDSCGLWLQSVGMYTCMYTSVCASMCVAQDCT